MKKNKSGKFNIPEKDELILLKHWSKDIYNNLLKIPENLKEKITEQQATNLFAYYQDLGDNGKNNLNMKSIENRIKELEDKFQKQKEQSFWHILKKRFKEETAKYIVWIIMSLIGFILGYLVNNFMK
ncbi:hypothetical protein KKA94_03780 [Patescibacteria group bacterium]|nr:hypothetical protein [Patescibacteria group bacterium]